MCPTQGSNGDLLSCTCQDIGSPDKAVGIGTQRRSRSGYEEEHVGSGVLPTGQSDVMGYTASLPAPAFPPARVGACETDVQAVVILVTCAEQGRAQPGYLCRAGPGRCGGLRPVHHLGWGCPRSHPQGHPDAAPLCQGLEKMELHPCHCPAGMAHCGLVALCADSGTGETESTAVLGRVLEKGSPDAVSSRHVELHAATRLGHGCTGSAATDHGSAKMRQGQLLAPDSLVSEPGPPATGARACGCAVAFSCEHPASALDAGVGLQEASVDLGPVYTTGLAVYRLQEASVALGSCLHHWAGYVRTAGSRGSPESYCTSGWLVWGPWGTDTPKSPVHTTGGLVGAAGGRGSAGPVVPVDDWVLSPHIRPAEGFLQQPVLG
ncbi:hypothetical protein TREES_T100017645 [Tupaia chinensis]|uniref:Uncharacterized protein n=1 Tax=Tupaia chinensis TaxID=246437 RepID=L9L7U4_TUPCH|nr:hypothetical protein TREES_T100017645 [Tupaia chinensis]